MHADSLNLTGCINLKELPEGLVVRKDLVLTGSGVTSIPEDAKIHGYVVWDNDRKEKYKNGKPVAQSVASRINDSGNRSGLPDF